MKFQPEITASVITGVAAIFATVIAASVQNSIVTKDGVNDSTTIRIEPVHTTIKIENQKTFFDKVYPIYYESKKSLSEYKKCKNSINEKESCNVKLNNISAKLNSASLWFELCDVYKTGEICRDIFMLKEQIYNIERSEK